MLSVQALFWRVYLAHAALVLVAECIRYFKPADLRDSLLRRHQRQQDLAVCIPAAALAFGQTVGGERTGFEIVLAVTGAKRDAGVAPRQREQRSFRTDFRRDAGIAVTAPREAKRRPTQRLSPGLIEGLALTVAPAPRQRPFAKHERAACRAQGG